MLVRVLLALLGDASLREIERERGSGEISIYGQEASIGLEEEVEPDR